MGVPVGCPGILFPPRLFLILVTNVNYFLFYEFTMYSVWIRMHILF